MNVSAKRKIKSKAGISMARIVPTDFSYKYFRAGSPCSSNRFAPCGNTMDPIALVGMLARLLIRTAILNTLVAVGDSIAPSIIWSIESERIALIEVPIEYLPYLKIRFVQDQSNRKKLCIRLRANRYDGNVATIFEKKLAYTNFIGVTSKLNK